MLMKKDSFLSLHLHRLPPDHPIYSGSLPSPSPGPMTKGTQGSHIVLILEVGLGKAFSEPAASWFDFCLMLLLA